MARAVKSVQHTAELARRRERRRRRFVMLLAGGLIAAVAIFAGYTYWLRDSSLVGIKNLEVLGVSAHTEEGGQIVDAVEVATGEMTTLHVKPELLEEELSRFPRVESATIKADFPNSATVTVTERGNGSIFDTGSEKLLIATDGTVLGTAGAGTESLPKIGVGDPPAGPALEGRTLVQALVLGAAPSELRPFTEESDFSKDGVEVTMSNGLVLLFGDASKADQKWKAAASVIADPELTDASYVDLSVPRRPAIRGSEEAVPEEEVVPEEPVETIPPG
ncbi:MAG TPA: FtsQ-type POTRA domain-containing protein [Solirubrobacterales bacterium]|nr:FtsQ-type POTRA domain-containing protein [Solirubrobacterales bacterium]